MFYFLSFCPFPCVFFLSCVFAETWHIRFSIIPRLSSTERKPHSAVIAGCRTARGSVKGTSTFAAKGESWIWRLLLHLHPKGRHCPTKSWEFPKFVFEMCFGLTPSHHTDLKKQTECISQIFISQSSSQVVLLLSSFGRTEKYLHKYTNSK